MRKLKSMEDVGRIITYKSDLRDGKGNIIPFVRFLNMKLIEIISLMDSNDYTYEIDF